MVSVCHVVNAVSDTSAPADLATALTTYTDMRDVSIAAWFRAEGFRGEDRVEVHEIGAPRNALGADYRSIRRLLDLINGHDVVHTHHNHSGLFGKLAARLSGCALVSTEHNNHGGFSWKGRLANGVTNPLADRVVCVSESVRDSFTRWESAVLGAEKIAVINNGIDVERLRNGTGSNWLLEDEVDIDPNAILVGNAAMLTQQKAHDTLIRAVRLAIDRSDGDVELVVAGRGPSLAELETLVDELGVDEHVHLLGYLDRREYVYAMMDQVDIYAMPSRWEGFCVAALEAMALGTPCVFSDIAEFRKPFGNVALYHPVDDPSALADRLLTLASDDGLRDRLGQEGRTLVRDHYSLEAVAKRYRSVYGEVTSGSSSGRSD